jgi:hypothetical protein
VNAPRLARTAQRALGSGHHVYSPGGRPRPDHQVADGRDRRAAPTARLGLRGESRRLARAGLQGRRWRAAPQPEPSGSNPAIPELAAAVAALDPPTLLLDGEIAVFDRHLVSHFEWLRARPKDDTATPRLLMAFDCLYARGQRPPEAGVAGQSEAHQDCKRL